MGRTMFALVLCSVAATFVPGRNAVASGQVIQGRLTDVTNAEGVVGAMVALFDDRDREHDRALTRGDGSYVVTAPGAGEFRIRIERIGYATTVSRLVRLAAADTVTLDLAAPQEAISLEGIEVRATADDRQCTLRPEEGRAVAQVWEEARKALVAAAWTTRQSLHRYETLRIRREWDEGGRKVESEERSFAQSYTSAPYSARSADSLVTGGFVDIKPDGINFWAPDAEVLLSDAFLDTHCLRLLSPSESAASVTEIAFEPAEPGGVPDIAGTMRLDRQTAHLLRVDFRFINLNVPRWLLDVEPGGSVEFMRLPGGAWIIPSWHMRMFRAADAINRLTGRRYARLEGVTVISGNVLRAQGEDGVWEGSHGYRITGVLRDSLEAGLPNALVFLAGSGAQAATDSTGRFELSHLVPGEYTLHFSHPYLDSLSYEPKPYEVKVDAGASQPAEIVMDAPPLREVLDRICDSDSPPSLMMTTENPARLVSRAAILTGYVRDRRGQGVADARVLIATDALLDPKELVTPSGVDPTAMKSKQLRHWASEKTAPGGFYRLCWVPVDVPLEVMVLPPDEFDDDRLDEAASLREAFPSYPSDSIAVERQLPHKTLDVTLRGKES